MPDSDGDALVSRDLTLSSDADESSGKYSREEPISFKQSRERAQSSREAAESRGETLDEFSVPNVEESAGSDESAAEACNVPASSESFESLVREDLLDDSEQAITLATGETSSMSYEFVRTTVRGETVFAVLSSGMSGVVVSSSVERFGTSVSTRSVSVSADAVGEAVAVARKREKRRSRYRDPSWYVSELSTAQAETVSGVLGEVVSALLRSVVLMGSEERSRRDVQVVVVDGSIVVGGAGVGRCVRDRLDEMLSDAQVDAVVDSLPDLVTESCEGACQNEVSRMETLSGGECVVAGRLLLE
jgi:hypothetical protein